MKKIALTSLLTIAMASAAHASVNVMDGNPLYMPKAGHFYSETSLGSNTKTIEDWALGEDFGYGITDRFAINLATSLAEGESFDIFGWNGLSLGATYRVLKDGHWVADVVGSYNIDGWLYEYDEKKDDGFFMKEDKLNYTWKAGIRGGYTTARFTVAGHAIFSYKNTESFNWNEDDDYKALDIDETSGYRKGEYGHRVAFGLDGQYVIDRNWNLVAGIEYSGSIDDGAKNSGHLFGDFGVNYNIDSSHYVGAYVSGEMVHATGDWKWHEGMGFGVKFGVDF